MMTLTAIHADTTRGFDILRGKNVLAHFATYEEAWDYARKHGRGCVVRYWVA